jgi:hypothetical protein
MLLFEYISYFFFTLYIDCFMMMARNPLDLMDEQEETGVK